MLNPDLHRRILEALRETGGNKTETARRVGCKRQTVIDHAKAAEAEAKAEAGEAARPSAAPVADPASVVLALLKKGEHGLTALASAIRATEAQALDAIETLTAQGYNVRRVGQSWCLERTQETASAAGRVVEYRSRPDGTYCFGAMGDTHLGSKYERLDVLNRLYDRFEDEGVDRVFHTGNWIEGEARFNRHDLIVHGMDAQVSYLCDQYPVREDIHTYAVAGDDHEGWYGQREGIDIGRHAENLMRRAGRSDWHDLGFMEANVRLVHAVTGKSAMLTVVHPGGGSAYALSYTVQKIVESYGGGEKPAVGLYGHYHKLEFASIRNVWTFQTGCTQDQTPFMRKKRLEAHVGGHVVKLVQDPDTGAIIECQDTMLRFFNRGYYNDRWSHAGRVVLPERGQF